jgi:hypothetical protein
MYFFIFFSCILISPKFFSPTNAPFINHIKCSNVQLKYLYVCYYMFRSNWTILRELMLSLAKATIMWSWSVKIHRYMIFGVVATSISGCGVWTACRVVCDCSRTLHGRQPEIIVATIPHIIKRCIFSDQFHKIVALARISISSLRMVQLDQNME